MTAVLQPREEATLSDDDLLVARARAGDDGAFGELLRTHDDKMRGVAWRLVGSREAMDDVLQDAYLKAWKGIGGFRSEAAFSSWLYRIVHTTALDHLKRVRPIVPLDFEPDAVVEDPAATLARSSALRQAMASLPPDQCAVVALVDGEGHAYDEAAAMLDVSPGTIASRLHRGRAALRAALDEEETR